jgi:hypothetical protein
MSVRPVGPFAALQEFGGLNVAQQVLFVVEGETDAAVLRKLLPKSFTNVRFFAAGGRMSLASLARNLLIHEGAPVMVVADGGTLDADRLQEDRANLQLALRNVAPGGRFGVFLFVPEIEVLFFESEQVVEAISAGTSVSLVAAEYGKALPRRTLAEILRGESFGSWLETIDPQTWDMVRGGEQAQSFLGAVHKLLSRPLEKRRS